jgi:hypothetical protein
MLACCGECSRGGGNVDAGGADSGPGDAGAPDAGPRDAGGSDAGQDDAGSTTGSDAGPDGGPVDGGSPDGGSVDGGTLDAGPLACGTLSGVTITTTDFCSDDCWCWEVPFPQGNALASLWAQPDGGVWAVGTVGMIMQWADGGWLRRRSGTQADLNVIQGTSDEDIWVGGQQGTVLHWDGGVWASVPSPAQATDSIVAIWGQSSQDVWATSPLMHWDGTQWALVPAPISPTALWGTSATDVWIGGGGTVYRSDGGGWTNVGVDAGTEPVLFITGSSASDVWIECSFPPADQHAVLFHSEDGGWASYQFTDIGASWALSALWANSPSDAWATMSGFQFIHWDGGSWSPVNWGEAQTAPNSYYSALSGNGSGQVWAAGYSGRVLRLDGGEWEQFAGGQGNDFFGVWNGDGENAFAVGSAGAWRRVNGSWTFSVPTPFSLYGVWGDSPNDVYAVGSAIYHWDGGAWAVVGADDGNSIWGSGPSDVWVSGAATVHWDGGVWSTVAAAPGSAFSIYGFSSTDVWFADEYAIFRWDGQIATPVPAPNTEEYRAIWGTSDDDIWTAGWNLDHWDGATWVTSLNLGTGNYLTSIWGSGPDDIWAVGATWSGNVYHWDGHAWHASLPAAALFWSLSATNAHDMRAAGGEVTMRYRP